MVLVFESSRVPRYSDPLFLFLSLRKIPTVSIGVLAHSLD